MKRALVVGSCVAAATTLVIGAAPAYADTGSATAKAAYGSAATISPSSPSSSGLLGATVAAVVQPLVNTLTSTVNTTLSTAVNTLLNTSGNTADTNGGASTYPKGSTLGVVVPGLVTLAINGPAGSATADSTGYAAASSFSHSTLSLLGASVADLGVASASASCPTSGSPTSSVSLTGVNLFNGAVRAQLSSGSNLLKVSLDGGASYQSINSISSTLTPVSGTNVSVRANGNFLQVSEAISLDTLLNSLGLSTLLSGLSGVVDTSSTALTLSLTVGPSATSDATGASASGLIVGADLSGTVNVQMLSILGGLLGGATITIPSGICAGSYGNLLNLTLAYAACTAGASAPTTKWIPPGLI